MVAMNWRRWWVARPTREQQAAHDRDVADAARAVDVLRLTIDDEMICTGVRGTVETSDGLILNTAAELLRYLRAIPTAASTGDDFDAVVERLNAELVHAYIRIGDLEAENDRLRYGKAAS